MNPDFYDESIRKLYIEEKMAMNKISKKLGIATGKVYNRIKYMGITSRSISDYDQTEKQIENSMKLGKSRKGVKLTEQTKEKISKAKYKGGIGYKKTRKDGYVAIHFPDHPDANKEGMVMEHRLIMECVIGRRLKEDEVVHHKNKNKSDNRLENLQLMTFKEHAALHLKERLNNRRNDLSIK